LILGLGFVFNFVNQFFGLLSTTFQLLLLLLLASNIEDVGVDQLFKLTSVDRLLVREKLSRSPTEEKSTPISTASLS